MPEPPLDFIHRNAPIFARVGSVVATYRTRGNRRFGPYYRLIYRQEGRQRSLYLGPSEQQAVQVRQLLAELQFTLAPPRLDEHSTTRSSGDSHTPEGWSKCQLKYPLDLTQLPAENTR